MKLFTLAVLLFTSTAFAQSNVVGLPSSGGGSTTYSQGASGSVSRNISAKLQETVSVLDFGADPTGTNDSTAAFNNAIAALPNGGNLYIPHGTYAVNPTSSFKPVSGTIVRGDGPYSTTVKYSGSASTPVWLANSYVNGTGGSGQFLKFQDFTMTGNSAASSTCFSVGTPNTSTAKVQNVTFENMRVTACGSGGAIQINDVWDLNILHSDIGYNLNDGLAITDPDAVTGLYIIGTRIHNNGGHAINNTGAGTVTQFEQYGGEDTYSGATEVVLGNCRDCDLYGVWTEEAAAGSAQNGIDVSGAIQVRIDNLHSNYANNVVYASASVSNISISNSTATNAQGSFVNVPTGSTKIDFGQNNRSNVGVSVGSATAQNTIDCVNATTFTLTSSTGLAVNGCLGSNVITLGSNGALEAYLSNTGNFYLKGGLLSLSGSSYGQITTGTSGAGPTTTRNTADAVAASTDNNANASSTGDIHDFQSQGTNQDGFTVQGVPFYRIGSAVTAAATIAPTSPAFHITGTTSVSTITPPTSCTNTTQSGCTLRVIPDSATPFTTGGNIAVATTAVVGKVLIFTYDPAQSKWYGSY